MAEYPGRNDKYDAAVVGSGPNGLAAAITLAREGYSVIVLEAKDTIGGGARSKELTLSGFTHDICSAVHPLAVGSPFFKDLPLEKFGLEWIHPPLPLAHPLDGGKAVFLTRSVAETAAQFPSDAQVYQKLFKPLVSHWEQLAVDILGPFKLPHRPLVSVKFGLKAVQSARKFAERTFKDVETRALFAGIAAHSVLPLEKPLSAAVGIILGIAGHAVGWPIPRGGSQQIANALSGYFQELSGEIATNVNVRSLSDLPVADAVLFDVTPRQLLSIVGEKFSRGYAEQLKYYRYGPGVFKLDLALDGPIPWQNKACSQSGTVHIGGTLEEIAVAEKKVWEGKPPERPFVLLAQPSLFDPTRAPERKHTVWAYCHVPNGSAVDMTAMIENQIERFAPGFRKLILARHKITASEFESYNQNYIGGDINGGVLDWRQLFSRPALRFDPYSTPERKFYICSSSTPPGGGVHGMGGYYAAISAMRRVFQNKKVWP